MAAAADQPALSESFEADVRELGDVLGGAFEEKDVRKELLRHKLQQDRKMIVVDQLLARQPDDQSIDAAPVPDVSEQQKDVDLKFLKEMFPAQPTETVRQIYTQASFDVERAIERLFELPAPSASTSESGRPPTQQSAKSNQADYDDDDDVMVIDAPNVETPAVPAQEHVQLADVRLAHMVVGDVVNSDLAQTERGVLELWRLALSGRVSLQHFYTRMDSDPQLTALLADVLSVPVPSVHTRIRRVLREPVMAALCERMRSGAREWQVPGIQMGDEPVNEESESGPGRAAGGQAQLDAGESAKADSDENNNADAGSAKRTVAAAANEADRMPQDPHGAPVAVTNSAFGQSRVVKDQIEYLIDVFGEEHRELIKQRLERALDASSLETICDGLFNDMQEIQDQMVDLPQTDTAASERPPPFKKRYSLGPHVDRTVVNKLSADEKRWAIDVQRMFPKADPNHIIQHIVHMPVQQLVEQMSTEPYPLLESRLERERIQNRRLEYEDPAQFNVLEYLVTFNNDPATYWTDQTRKMSQLYKDHAKAWLANRYSRMTDAFLARALQEFNHHLLPVVDMIEGPNSAALPAPTIKQRTKTALPYQWKQTQFMQTRRQEVPMPEQIDELFYKELQYIVHRKLIQDTLAQRAADRVARLQQAAEAHELQECDICADDQVLPEEMMQCTADEPHSYCKTCVTQHADTQVQEGGHRVKCMDGHCEAEYPLQQVRAMLRPDVVNLMLKRAQQDELRRACLDNMAECPFCEFAMIIDIEHERVFRCQNPLCLKESCRECREPSHIPFRCDELEQDAETRMRVFVENEMANALIRVCPSCDTRIVKTDGCNKMTCKCGSKFCYVCREQVQDYSHFHHQDMGGQATAKAKCPLYTSIDQVNAQAAKEAGQKAQAKYLEQHPAARLIAERAGQLDFDSLVDVVHANAPINLQLMRDGQGAVQQVIITYPRDMPQKIYNLTGPHAAQHIQALTREWAQIVQLARTNGAIMAELQVLQNAMQLHRQQQHQQQMAQLQAQQAARAQAAHAARIQRGRAGARARRE